MATTLSVGDVLETLLVCRADPQFGINVRHYRVSLVGGSPATLADAVGAVEDYFHERYKAWLSASAQWWGAKMTRIKPTRSQPETAFVQRGVGDNGTDLIPRQAAGVIKLKTDLGGRHGRGRMYIPFPPEEFNDASGDLEAAAITALQGIGNFADDTIAVSAGGRTASIVPVLYNRKTAAVTDINGFQERVKWGTQRRRSNINRPDADPLAP